MMEIQQRDSSSLLLNAYKTGKWSDLTIINKDKHYHVHKVVLCHKSPYFDKITSSEPSGHIIELDFPTLLFDIIIEWIYFEKILITKENALDLFHLADHMQITELTDELFNFLWNHFSDSALEDIDFWINNFFKKMKNESLSRFRYSSFVDKYIQSNFWDIVHTNAFLDYDVGTVAHMIDLNALDIENEMQVFEAIIKWIQKDEKKRSLYLSKLLKKIHWTDINTRQAMSRIYELPWIMKCDQARHVIMAAVELMIYKSIEEIQVYDVNLKSRYKSSYFPYCIYNTDNNNEIIALESMRKPERKAITLFKDPNLSVAKPTDLYLTEHTINSDSVMRIDWRNKTYRLLKEHGSFYCRSFGRSFKFSPVDKKVYLYKGDRSIEFAPFSDVGFPIRTVTKDKGLFYSIFIIDVTPVPIFNPSNMTLSYVFPGLSPNPEFKLKLFVKIFDENEKVWQEVASHEIITQERIRVLKSTIFRDLMIILMDQAPIFIYNLDSQSFEEYTNIKISLNEQTDLHFLHDNSNLIIYHRPEFEKAYKKSIFEICDGKLTLVCELDGLHSCEDIWGFISLDKQFFNNSRSTCM